MITPRHILILAAALLAVMAVSQASAQQPHKTPRRRVPFGLVNHRLNIVEDDLDALGIGFKTKGGGVFGIILKRDWGVCATIPAAGQIIHGPVELVVGHFTCGA